MKAAYVIPIMILLVIVPTLAEARLEYMESNAVINSTKIDFSVRIIFQDVPAGTFEYPLFYKVDDFRSGGNIGGVACEAQRKPWGTNIACDFTNAERTGRTLELRYETTDLVDIVDNQRVFSDNIRAPDDTKRLVVRTYLAQGFVLVGPDSGPLPPYTPLDGVSGTDGRVIYVVWNRNETSKGEGVPVTVAYERVIPQASSDIPLLLVIGFAGLIAVLLLLILLKRRGTEQPVSLTLLKEDERKIVEFLKSQGGIAKQRAIVAHTGFSKAKVSRLVRDLELRGLLAVKGMGRVNEVKLLGPKDQKEEKTAKTPVNEVNKAQEGEIKKEDV
ncbi:MAG: hypothetical protein HYS81_04915 [Candidatus Aenigmatarchaeota archaeon]|nr:MAG: hypothetical protein HYS81_04915 [Candidatus Aenigmarchaeota archaeon]